MTKVDLREAIRRELDLGIGGEAFRMDELEEIVDALDGEDEVDEVLADTVERDVSPGDHPRAKDLRAAAVRAVGAGSGTTGVDVEPTFNELELDHILRALSEEDTA